MTSGLSWRSKPCISLIEHSVRRRCYLTSSSVVPRGDQLGPIQQEAHQSFRERKHGKRLPLPPVLDPVVLAERSQWEQPKVRPNIDKITPFQQKLRENPYAHALASPVRECRGTGLFFPSDLMVTLHPRPHPETSHYWLLPVSLTTPKKHLGVPYRFLGRLFLAEWLSQKNQWKPGLYPRMFEKFKESAHKMVWREDMPDLILKLLRKQVMDKLRWHFKFPGRGRLVPCESPRSEDIDEIEDVACVLYFGTLRTKAEDVKIRADRMINEIEEIVNEYAKAAKDQLDPHLKVPTSSDVPHHSPPSWWKGPTVPRLKPRLRFPSLDFRTTEWRQSRVAVYSLHDLLGEENARELREGSKLEHRRCLVLKRARHNVHVQLLLMRLQAYIAPTGFQ